MSRRQSITSGRTNRRRTTLLWIAAGAVVIIALLYWEQTALLYVLATLGVTALLVVVALADLSGARKASHESAPADDSAAIGNAVVATSPSVQPSVGRATRRK